MSEGRAGPVQTGFRLSAEMIAQLDDIAKAINERRPWPKVTRSDLVRQILAHVLKERPAWLFGEHGLKPDP